MGRGDIDAAICCPQILGPDPVFVDGDSPDAGTHAAQGQPGLGVAGIFERDLAARQVADDGHGGQGCRDARKQEHVGRVGGQRAGSAQVLA